MDGPISIELHGHIAAKKNNWRPRKGGGIMLDREAKEAIDRLAMQIPGRVRDLNLESPQIEFMFTYVNANWDRDNAVTTLLDLLVKYGVIANDNIRRCNGTITIYPAVKGDYDSVKIILIPAIVKSESPRRYLTMREAREVALAAVSNLNQCPIPTSDAFAGMEDYLVEE